MTVLDDSIHGDFLAGPDNNQVTDKDIINGDLDFHSVAHDAGRPVRRPMSLRIAWLVWPLARTSSA